MLKAIVRNVGDTVFGFRLGRKQIASVLSSSNDEIRTVVITADRDHSA